MGTQFTSRLTRADTVKVLDAIRTAHRTVTSKRKKTVPVAPLSAVEKRKLGDATMAQVLLVAEERDFSKEFQKSELFIQVLDWLKQLRSDATFAGFKGIASKYDLESYPNPVPVLTRGLREITNAEAAQQDPFRVSVSAAARGVLAEVATRSVKAKVAESAANRFGRRLASMSLKELVDHFIRGFIADFLERVISRSDPSHSEKLVEEAKVLTIKSAERVARGIAKRVEKEGKLNDSERNRDITFEELRLRIEGVGKLVPN